MPPSLRARTVPISPIAFTGLLDLLPNPEAIDGNAWVRHGEGLVGWGQAARIDASGSSRFGDADARWRALTRQMVIRDEVQQPGTGPVAFGSFSFADDSSAGGTLVVPRLVAGMRGGQAWLTSIQPASDPTSPFDLSALLRARAALLPPAAVIDEVEGCRKRQWYQGVQRILRLIQQEGLSKAVLARDVVAHTGTPIDVRRLLQNLAEDYPSCWTFAVDGLIGATPELLVRRERGLISSRVLAGTIQRTGDDDADLARATSLARSTKEVREHEFAVDSLTAALAPYAASTKAPDTPFVLHLPNVLHLATDVTAVLAREHAQMSSLQVAALLHPTAAVCGTPTARATQVISEHEGMDRRRYAGPVGWLGADGDGEWGLALRSAQVDSSARQVRMFAGCGIVAASDPAREWEESEAKLAPMRAALAR